MGGKAGIGPLRVPGRAGIDFCVGASEQCDADDGAATLSLHDGTASLTFSGTGEEAPKVSLQTSGPRRVITGARA